LIKINVPASFVSRIINHVLTSPNSAENGIFFSGFVKIKEEEISLIKTWKRRLSKQKNTGKSHTEVPANNSNEKMLESSDLPEWLASSGNFVTLKNYFGDQLKCLSCLVSSKYPSSVGLIFIQGVTDCELVAEFSRRILAIRVERLSGTYWIFPGFQMTQQPKSAAVALQRGQILLALKDEPLLAIAPATFLFFFQKPGSDWNQWLSVGLLLRVGAFALAAFLPALYMALISYQYYAVPLQLFFLVAESRLKAPLPPLIEVLLLEALLEMFREGAAKVSNPVGIVIGTLGGLLAAAGIAAVGLVSPIAALFCGTAQLAALVLPIKDLLATIRWLKYGSIIMAAIFGVLGAVITASLTVVHLVSLGLSDWPYLQSGDRIKRTEK
jgi:spore germination protein